VQPCWLDVEAVCGQFAEWANLKSQIGEVLRR
jgi:hypothetical protein